MSENKNRKQHLIPQAWLSDSALPEVTVPAQTLLLLPVKGQLPMSPLLSTKNRFLLGP
jgi:hypothetical protein